MFFCFEIVDRDGYMLPRPSTFEFSKTGVDYKYCVDTRLCPDQFHMRYNEESKSTEWFQLLTSGFNNLPVYAFDKALYESKQNPFVPFDPQGSEEIRRGIRRAILNERSLRPVLPYDTELKKARKAIVALINLVSTAVGVDVASVPELQEYISFSEFVDSRIQTVFPKEKAANISVPKRSDIMREQTVLKRDNKSRRERK